MSQKGCTASLMLPRHGKLGLTERERSKEFVKSVKMRVLKREKGHFEDGTTE